MANTERERRKAEVRLRAEHFRRELSFFQSERDRFDKLAKQALRALQDNLATAYAFEMTTAEIWVESPWKAPPPLALRIDADGDPIPWGQEHDYFMAFDPENPDIPTD